MRFVGESVIGLTIIPLSDRLTRSTSDACSSIERFLWMTPRPPCGAIAIASRDSVTVSIAALTSGTARRIRRVSRVLTSTCVGTTSECCGTSSTSSKVSAVLRPASIEMRDGGSVFSIDNKKADRGRPEVRTMTGDWQPVTDDAHQAAAPWHFLYFLPLPHGQ